MLVVIHAALTWMMTGLIWFVQLVHYPLLARVGRESFVDYEREHCTRTGWIAGPLMVAEAAAAGLLLFRSSSAGLSQALVAQAGALLLGLIWMSTFLIQSPAHGRLCDGFDAGEQRSLVEGNWLRTLLWSVRSALAAFLLLP